VIRICRFVLAAAEIALAAGGVGVGTSYAQTTVQRFPSKAIRFVSPFAAGGSTDGLARLIAQRLSETWELPVVVENRPGAGGTLGSDIVAKAPPDGYTLLLTSVSAHAIGPAMRRRMPYDPVRDFVAISQVASGHNVLVVHPSLPAKSVKELLALARARPAQLTYGSGGIGTTTHIAGELFKALGKVDLVHVPYKGGAPLAIALSSGEISISFGSIATVLPQMRSGRLRGLAVTGAARTQAMAQLPTVAEAGIPGYEMNSWYGVLAPGATPRDIVLKLSAEIVRIIKLPETRERLAHEGQEAAGTTADEFAAYLRSEVEKWSRVVKSAGIAAE
jgi:tripartite-type tricarboxylate transporter receptor subunit TctC